MASINITTKEVKAKVKKVIKDIPKILAGEMKDPHKLHNKFWGAVAQSMFESISTAFERKSQGLQDDLGITWKDITPETKAYHRPAYRGDLSRSQRVSLNNPSTLGMLTPNQYAKWRKIFGVVYHSNRSRIPDDEAKALAGQIAWKKLKEEGADTKIRVLGDRNLLILRDTDRLFRSFLPGKLTKHSYRAYNRDQLYVVNKGSIELGTKVEYADEVFEDRPLWGVDLGPWMEKAIAAGNKRIVEYLEDVL